MFISFQILIKISITYLYFFFFCSIICITNLSWWSQPILNDKMTYDWNLMIPVNDRHSISERASRKLYLGLEPEGCRLNTPDWQGNLGGVSKWLMLFPPSTTTTELPLSKAYNPKLIQWNCSVAKNTVVVLSNSQVWMSVTNCNCMNVKECVA